MRPILFQIIIAAMLMAAFPAGAFAANEDASRDLKLVRHYDPTNFPDPELDDEGHRAPARPVSCTLSNEYGVTISGCSEVILSFEIWDAEGEICLFVSSDQFEFIDELFSSEGEFQIRMLSESYIYIGYICI